MLMATNGLIKYLSSLIYLVKFVTSKTGSDADLYSLAEMQMLGLVNNFMIGYVRWLVLGEES